MGRKKVSSSKKMGGGMMQRPMGYAVGGPSSPTTGPMNIPRDRDGKPIKRLQRQQGPKARKPGGRKSGAGPAAGLPSLAGKRKGKEDSSVTLGKFMKAKIDSTNESIKGGGMKADRVTEGSNMRNKKGFRKDVEEGKYKQTKDAAYYKSIGLTGKRGDQAVKDFFKPYHMRSDAIKLKSGGMTKPMGYKSGTSVKVKCKLGRNKPTKMY